MYKHQLFYRHRQRGATFVLSAISMMALILCVGLAVDSGIGYGVRAKLNAATDAAAIAAGRAISLGEEEAKEAAEKFFYANYPDNYLGSTATFDADDVSHFSINTHDDGSITVDVSANADVPTYFMRLENFQVAAATQVTRRDLDMILVLDTSGSLTSPSDTPGKLRDASVNFINKFVDAAGGDRVGLVVYASGAEIEEPIDKTSTRGFDKAQITSDINSLNFSGITASGEALRIAHDELNAIPEDLRSSLRVIVFFSDGAPNTVAAQYTTGGGGSISGDLFSETSSGGPPNRLWRNDLRNQFLGTASINQLPSQGLGNVDTESYNSIRTLTPPAGSPNSNNRCNINKAGRNMAENMGDTIRDDDIRVYTLGLGARLEDLEVTFCGYGSSEYGANILRRIANTTDADTYNSDHYPGLYVYAENADELDAAFNTIASEILRLTK